MVPSTDIRGYRAGAGRISYFDNVKFVLIVSVVVGHLLKFGGTLHHDYAKAVFVLIYSFHMPLFVFVSGLFLNRGKMTWGKTWRRAGEFFLLGVLAKLLRAVWPWLLGMGWEFDLFSEGGLPWFMFALATYYLLAWFLRGQDERLVAGASLAIALAAGHFPAIGDGLCLSRIIVFFPFFWLGFLLSPRSVQHVASMPEVRRVCAIILGIVVITGLLWPRGLYLFRGLFVGRYSYAEARIAGCFWGHRLVAYLISLLIGVAVLGVIPLRNLGVLTQGGRRTLQVYLLHFELIDLLQFLRVPSTLVHCFSEGWILLVPLGLAITLCLSLFDLPQAWVRHVLASECA